MSVRNARVPLLVAAVLVAIAMLHYWRGTRAPDGASSQPQPSTADVVHGDMPRAPVVTPRAAASASAASAHPSAATSTSPSSGDAVPALHVGAPTQALQGEVFEARVDVQAPGGLHDLSFTVTYDKKRLALVGWSPGGFAQVEASPPQLTVQEPSEGNVDVRFSLGDARFMSGAGSVVVLKFEAIRRGTSPIRVESAAIGDHAGITERRSMSTGRGALLTIR
jgi:hypothetical protein